MARLSAPGEIVRAHDPDRYLCDLFAEPKAREGLFALHAFNHEVAKIREVVSDPMLGHIRLQWWREALDGIFAGTPRQHEVVLGLAWAFETFELDRAGFDDLLEAREIDLDDAPFATIDALIDYARRTAGMISGIGLAILGVQDPATTRTADDIAVATALTGLLRAMPYLARSKRSMLPQDIFQARGARLGDYHELRDRPQLRAVVQTVAETANQHLLAARLRSGIRFKAAAPVILPGRLSALYLQRLQRAGWNAFDATINAPMPMKPWALWRASLLRRF
ncbi:MAG: phytoene/squalene synthase family protein [Proteobacteria bacterium]|nr:phytoene/squalene synthase family protein [Pseudomonadota bacterium]MDA1311345.1 phytoene/squalene synthase family protein [Pseudomonadota bacterium]